MMKFDKKNYLWVEANYFLMDKNNLSHFISIDSEIRFGKPVVKGTRISVYDVLNWLASGMSKQEIIADFTELDEQQIHACLSYAANRE